MGINEALFMSIYTVYANNWFKCLKPVGNKNIPSRLLIMLFIHLETQIISS